VACILAMIGFESIGMHLLVQIWSVKAAWIVTALDVYGALWLIGDYHALRLRPTYAKDGILHLRYGLRWNVEIPFDQIEAVGEIGTSPLYALRECFNPQHGVPVTPDNVMGILSLIFWSLTIVISFKYLVFVMRADNRGEGGILALMSLVRARSGPPSLRRSILIGLGIFGAALLY